MADSDSNQFPQSILARLLLFKPDAAWTERHDEYLRGVKRYQETNDYPPLLRRLMPMFIRVPFDGGGGIKMPRGYITRHDAYLKALRQYKRERGLPYRSKPQQQKIGGQ